MDTVAETAPQQPSPSPSRFLALVRRTPFTSINAALMIVLGFATQSFWRPLEDRSWFGYVGYGVPSIEAGHLWTPFTGPYFALVPAFYLFMTGSFVLVVGFVELRLGTRRTAIVCVTVQVVAVLLAILLVWALSSTGWPWAEAVATKLDVGFSGGMLGCAAVVSAGLRPPWRVRVRVLLILYVGISFFFVGTLADLVHLLSVLLALPFGPKVVGRARQRAVPSRREWRLLAIVGFLIIVVAEVVLWLVPASGPLGDTGYESGSALRIGLNIVIFGLIINGLRKGRTLAWWAAVVIAALNVLAGALSLGLAALDAFSDNPGGGDAQTIAASVLWGWQLVVLFAGRGAFRAPLARRLKRAGLPSATTREVARGLLERYGGSSVSWMTTWEDNSYFLTEDQQSFIAYQPHVGVAISIGDPVGPPGSGPDTVRAFAAMCERSGLAPCLFSVDAATVAVTDGLGWQRIQVAEDSVIDLDGLAFKGKKWQDVRSAVNRAAKEGITYREVKLADQPFAILSQVRAISEEWVGDKGLPEMGFTLGGVDEAMDPAVRVGLAVDADSSVHGVMSWMPVYADGGAVEGWTLDVMRRRNGAFRPVVEFLIASACLSFQQQGARFVSLSGAPLARSDSSESMSGVERMLDTLGEAMEPMYGFRSLHAFKAKFSPRYVPMYMAYRDEGDLPRIGIALTRAYLPEASMVDLVKMGVSRPH